MEHERKRDEQTRTPASELEGGGTDQDWGQGEGRHEPTIGREKAPTPSYPEGEAQRPDDTDRPLVRDDEGMDR
ncbi:MAG: hypothetical protein ACRDGV_02665 [Candidatus Limnocylindria bacterium]